MNNGIRYVGLDVHRDSISVAVRDSLGKLLRETVIATSEAAVLGLIKELGGTLHVVFEEGTWATWLYELLEGKVARVVVCDPRKNNRQGNKNDRIDARELSDLLRCGRLSAVFHADKRQRGLRDLRELARTYGVLSKEQTRTMNRIKALYRSYAIACAGPSCYGAKQREKWLAKLPYKAVQERARVYYQQLDSLLKLRQEVRKQLLEKGKKHAAYSKLKSIPWLGAISTVLVIAFMQIPDRFRSKRQLWAYCGFALETHSSADYRWVEGERQRAKKGPLVRGLNSNHHHVLKWIFKSAATRACSRPGPLQEFYFGLLEQGMRPEMARLTVARKMVAIALTLWKKGERFDAQRLKSQAA